MTLPVEVRQVLARLELVSNGTVYSYQPVASKGGFASCEPVTGDGWPAHLRFRIEFEEAEPGEYPAILKRAADELGSLTRRSAAVRAETPRQRCERMIREGEGFPAIDVATRFRCGLREVHRVRRDADRDIELGKPKAVRDPESRLTRVDRLARARELRERHPRMSFRQIAAIVGCDHKTVAADLRDAA